MNQHEVFTKFWEKELPAFREVIARIPEGSTYRPDPKSRTAREIAWLIVVEHKVLIEGLERGVIEWEEAQPPESMAAIVAVFDRVHPSSVPRLKALPAPRWEGDLPFTFQGKEAFRSSAHDMAWGFLFDTIHHRGQLSTYLRPMGAKVPQIYGPSADEGSGQ